MIPNPNARGAIPQRWPHIPAVLAALMGWGVAMIAALYLGFCLAALLLAVIP